jgi:hypothetical protein
MQGPVHWYNEDLCDAGLSMLLLRWPEQAAGCTLRRAQFMARIMLCVLHFRLGARYVEANPPFTSIEMDYSDSAREGCAVSTLTILSEPCDWRGAVQVLSAGDDHDTLSNIHLTAHRVRATADCAPASRISRRAVLCLALGACNRWQSRRCGGCSSLA